MSENMDIIIAGRLLRGKRRKKLPKEMTFQLAVEFTRQRMWPDKGIGKALEDGEIAYWKSPVWSLWSEQARQNGSTGWRSRAREEVGLPKSLTIIQ
jgi:hypothetical protein